MRGRFPVLQRVPLALPIRLAPEKGIAVVQNTLRGAFLVRSTVPSPAHSLLE